MHPAPSSEITELLQARSGRDQKAYKKTAERVYPELLKLVPRCLGDERPRHTIQTTALVDVAYLRLVEMQQIRWQDRAHFFAVSARVLRHILVDYARGRHSAKRGGGSRQVHSKGSRGNLTRIGPGGSELTEIL